MKQRCNQGQTGLSIVIVSLLLAAAGRAKENEVTIKSPDGKIVVGIQAGERLKYQVNFNGKPAVETSALGISVDGTDLGQKVELSGRPELKKINERYAT